MTLHDFDWFESLDPVRQEVIRDVGVERLNRPMLLAMQYSNWISAAFELWNSRQLHRDLGEERCRQLADALEYGFLPSYK